MADDPETEGPEVTDPPKNEEKEEGRTLTQDDINRLIEAARKQEKDKLYETISGLRDQVSSLADERKSEKEAREAAELLAQEKIETERQAKLSTEEKVTEQLKRLEERLANEAVAREKITAELLRERELADLERYRTELLQGKEDIIPELVRGNSKEEINASVAVAEAKYQHYFQAAVSKAEGTPGRRPANVPSPADPDPDALDEEDLKGLRGLQRPEMTTGSMKSREEIIANRNKGVSPEYIKQKEELLSKVGELYRKTVRG